MQILVANLAFLALFCSEIFVFEIFFFYNLRISKKRNIFARFFV